MTDPMGDDFYQKILQINQLSRDLVKFLNERGELYGIALNLMLDQGLYEYDLSFDDMIAVQSYMLVIEPNMDMKNVHMRIVPTEPPLKEE